MISRIYTSTHQPIVSSTILRVSAMLHRKIFYVGQTSGSENEAVLHNNSLVGFLGPEVDHEATFKVC